MNITDIQVFIQAYYIRHCRQNKNLTQRQKTLFIAAIVIFNIPAAAFYLFKSRKKLTAEDSVLPEAETDEAISQGIFALLILAYEIFTLLVIAKNTGNPFYPLIIGLLGTCFILMLAGGLPLRKRHTFLYYLLPALQILLILPADYLDNTFNPPFLVLVIVAGIINTMPHSTANIYSLACFNLYFIAGIFKARRLFGLYCDEVIGFLYANLMIFLLVYAVFYSLHKQLQTNRQLVAALDKIRKQSRELEKMAAVAERNRLAGEIHDAVGHTLTSATIAIETGEKLLAQDGQKAREKFSLAKDLVGRGLADIRTAVQTIKKGEKKDFSSRLEALLAEIRQNTGLTVNCYTDITSELLSIQQNVLLNAIKECATNSIKHGRSTEIDLLLQEYRGNIQLSISDNGTGAKSIDYGFGLNAMAERVQSIGGTMNVSGTEGEGFTVNITIPAGTEKGVTPL
jgi:signal transduction histidine kinase